MAEKRCLIYETLGKVSNLKVTESANSEMRLSGIFGVCGVKNQNNRVYDKENYKRMVESLQKVIKESGCPGELEHPNSMNINLENVSHKIEDIQMNEDGTVTGTILLLNTPKGQIAKAIVEGGLPLYISSRGSGTITNEGYVTLSTIKTYDLVGTPGFSQAKLTLKPNQTLECLNESVDDGNQVWAIVEEGDDLLGGDNKSDDKDDSKDKSDNKDNSSENSESQNSAEENNNKNKDNKDVNMKDLKEAIDKLTEKVNSLEAQLHVAQESLDDQVSVNYDAIEHWVKEEFGNEISKSLMDKVNLLIEEAQYDNDSIRDSIKEEVNNSINLLAEGVQNWVVREFAPEVQNWVTEEFAPEVQNWVTEEFAPEVQNWVTEEFAPEVQNWICEEFAPEVQNWIVEEYSPEVQNWITEEYSPEVQNWMCEEFAPEVQGWICEEFAPVVEGWINEEFTPNLENKINESSSATRLSEIDNLLEAISSDENSDVQKIVKEQKIDEKYNGIYVVENMPLEYAPSWQLLDENRKDEIVRSSKMYDFTKEGVLESFWANVDFDKQSVIKEQKNEDIISDYHNNIIAGMMRLRKTV